MTPVPKSPFNNFRNHELYLSFPFDDVFVVMFVDYLLFTYFLLFLLCYP